MRLYRVLCRGHQTLLTADIQVSPIPILARIRVSSIPIPHTPVYRPTLLLSRTNALQTYRYRPSLFYSKMYSSIQPSHRDHTGTLSDIPESSIPTL